ncbi:hypothetical protein ABTZ21_08860 [Streptomyces sp. NPDC096191]|uniref:hypothetical protein n=1 Tax=Streptomyces sp. NPDC096191 TaxID=3155426 RepID=UPI003328C6A6
MEADLFLIGHQGVCARDGHRTEAEYDLDAGLVQNGHGVLVHAGVAQRQDGVGPQFGPAAAGGRAPDAGGAVEHGRVAQCGQLLLQLGERAREEGPAVTAGAVSSTIPLCPARRARATACGT